MYNVNTYLQWNVEFFDRLDRNKLKKPFPVKYNLKVF